MEPSDAAPNSPRPKPLFTAAAWLLPVTTGVLTWISYLVAVAFRSPGEWLPGILELIIGAAVMAVGGFGCGVTALLRRERRCWMAVIPLLAGLAAILYFASNLLRHR